MVGNGQWLKMLQMVRNGPDEHRGALCAKLVSKLEITVYTVKVRIGQDQMRNYFESCRLVYIFMMCL